VSTDLRFKGRSFHSWS